MVELEQGSALWKSFLQRTGSTCMDLYLDPALPSRLSAVAWFEHEEVRSMRKLAPEIFLASWVYVEVLEYLIDRLRWAWEVGGGATFELCAIAHDFHQLHLGPFFICLPSLSSFVTSTAIPPSSKGCGATFVDLRCRDTSSRLKLRKTSWQRRQKTSYMLNHQNHARAPEGKAFDSSQIDFPQPESVLSIRWLCETKKFLRCPEDAPLHTVGILGKRESRASVWG